MPRTSAALLMYGIKDVREETGIKPTGPFIPLDPIKSNTFTMESPPKSGRQMEFPEIDRAEFFDLADGEAEDQGGAGSVDRGA